ncbi:MAG: N-acetyl-gamma-glutamyl-phosphate reductase [Firmicutes bacterium HGW-Firmicutes-16]|nr:MAG: N-acetyl-gamma-glutamyl-phosphate reductase [Firmicutes bacterium HGW-Firmicutes-16]
MTKVFIAGSEGTAGLRLASRLKERPDVDLLEIDSRLRKEPNEIKKLIEKSDFVFLCLPDEAAREMVELAKDTSARLIDTSTAHRTSVGWAYGFPELSHEHSSAIASAQYVASPGCHASGFISLIYPLISSGIISSDSPLSCVSLTGYSGGGKKMIAEYENASRDAELDSPKLYAMGQNHKHLPEIVSQCGLKVEPIFMPVVGDFYAGMLATIPLNFSLLNGKYTIEEIREVFKAHYKAQKLIKVLDNEASYLFANSLAGRDDMEIFVSGNDERILLTSRFDNLGKGAAGAAIECFNIMCGLPAETGLFLG